MTGTPHIPHDDLALYALQALAPGESAAVREHVEECGTCREELARLRGDLALLAISTEPEPLPQGARQRFLDRVAAAAPTQAQPARPAPPVSIATGRRPRLRATWIPWAAVAALLVFAITLQIRVGALHQQLRQQTAELDQQKAAGARAQALLDLLTAPAAQHVELTAAPTRRAPSARAVYLPSKGALLMQASNLDPVPAGKTYELWVIPTRGAPVPAGLFRPDAAGNASVVLPELPRGLQAKAFGVTVEDAGGATAPTLPIVLQGTPSTPGA